MGVAVGPESAPPELAPATGISNNARKASTLQLQPRIAPTDAFGMRCSSSCLALIMFVAGPVWRLVLTAFGYDVDSLPSQSVVEQLPRRTAVRVGASPR